MSTKVVAGCVFRYYVGIVLSCILLLLVAFFYLGLCFGACGETAGENGRLCSRSTGACLLLTYASISQVCFCCNLLCCQKIVLKKGGLVAEWLACWTEGPGFKSQRCQLTVLGKLFAPIVPLFTKQQNWQHRS